MDAEDDAYCVNVDEASTFSSRARVNQELMATGDAVVRVNCYEPVQVTPIHKHPEEDEVIYIVEGAAPRPTTVSRNQAAAGRTRAESLGPRLGIGSSRRETLRIRLIHTTLCLRPFSKRRTKDAARTADRSRITAKYAARSRSLPGTFGRPQRVLRKDLAERPGRRRNQGIGPDALCDDQCVPLLTELSLCRGSA